jgi:exonuclease III
MLPLAPAATAPVFARTLLSPALAPRLAKAGVDRAVRGEEGASDHALAWIVLK